MPDVPELAGKVAVVTGGFCGIGATTARLLADNGARAITARLLADNGARVAVNGRDQAALDAVVAGIGPRAGLRLGCWPTSPTSGDRADAGVGRLGMPEDVEQGFSCLQVELSAGPILRTTAPAQPGRSHHGSWDRIR